MKKLTFAAVCLLLGGSDCAYVLMRIDGPARFGWGRNGLLVLLLGSLIVCMAGFVAFLSWRDERNARGNNTGASKPLGNNAADGLQHGVCGLWPGATYRVIQPFKDHYGGQFALDEQLTFVSRDFLPYHGGHTLVFTPRSIYLQEELNADILQGLAEYLAWAEKDAPLPAAAPPERPLLVLRQDRYSPTEYICLDITASGVRSFLNDPASGLQEQWTFDEVRAGKADRTLRRDFGDEALAELKAAIPRFEPE